MALQQPTFIAIQQEEILIDAKEKHCRNNQKKNIRLSDSSTLLFILQVFLLLNMSIVVKASGSDLFGGSSAATTANSDEQLISMHHNIGGHSGRSSHKCVPITIDICSSIPYNMTIYPNLLKHAKQEEAEADIKQYDMLVKVQCSPYFRFFLCSLFTPVCTILNEPIPPCRHLCLSAKNGCEALMRKFGYSWPEIFNCDRFPHHSSGICVGENKNESAEATVENDDGTSGTFQSIQQKEYECPHTLKVIGTKTRYTLTVANTTIEQCSVPCQFDGIVPPFFNPPIQHYIKLWTGALAVACFVCTLFTITTFLIDLNRFEFPEKAILYMALCYLVVSVCYMVGLVAEDSLSCSIHSVTKQPLVAKGGFDNLSCAALGAVSYYFTQAGLLWWLILCFSWFLVTTLKWGEGPVGELLSFWFNLVAWLVPLVGTVWALITGTIDGDLFTGVCSVGNFVPTAVVHLVIIPQASIAAVGLLFFAIGFVSIVRIRRYIRSQVFFSKLESAEATEKISRLMLRISSFSLLYIVPVIVGILCSLYQAHNLDNWLTNWYTTRCLHAQRSIFGFTRPREHCPMVGESSTSAVSPPSDGVLLHQNFPEPLFFFAKYLGHFSIGMACAVWVLNGKTLQSYGELFGRIFHGGRQRVPTQMSAR